MRYRDFYLGAISGIPLFISLQNYSVYYILPVL